MTRRRNESANSLTLYMANADKPMMQRAKKLLFFHEDKTLSRFFVEKLNEVVAKYDCGGKRK